MQHDLTDEDMADLLGLEHSSLRLPELNPYVFTYTSPTGREVYILPTLHDQAYFSKLVQKCFDSDSFSFDHVMVELPGDIEQLHDAVKRLPYLTVVHDGELQQQGEVTLIPHPAHAYIVHPGESIYWATYLANHFGLKIDFIDHWTPDAFKSLHIPFDWPALATVGWKIFWQIIGEKILSNHQNSKNHNQRSIQMADHILEGIDDTLVVIGAAHWPIIDHLLRRASFEADHDIFHSLSPSTDKMEVLPQDFVTPDWRMADIHPHSLHLVVSDFPYTLAKVVEDSTQLDYMEIIRNLYFDAESVYQQKFDDQVSPANYRRMFQYLRNLGRIHGQSLPSLYHLITGAKGCVDDDFAFEVYRMAISYPFIPENDDKLEEMIKFAPDEEQGEVIRMAFKRRFKRPILKKVDDPELFDDLDPIPEEDYPGQWQEIWDKYSDFGMVSYPPEDEFIEQYLSYLRKRVKEVLMEEQASTMKFETSLEDGIDFRETVRHYHEGDIYVKKLPKNVEDVGALVVQFLEEPYDTTEYSNHSTLFAEHDQESHISVITTEPGDVMVGPGITKVKYAAIISQFPPVGMPYLISKENVDLKYRLIWSAMNMSLTRIIGYIAKKPPTAAQRHFASENGFRLIYLPMEQLTRSSLRRLRTMHLLAHRELRDIAREYIGF